LHWHVIPRWVDDSHFPAAIWAAAEKPAAEKRALPSTAALATVIGTVLAKEEAGA
jgi:diadenosine tetraphosphate (Ap4A) HIT family hydrolase